MITQLLCAPTAPLRPLLSALLCLSLAAVAQAKETDDRGTTAPATAPSTAPTTAPTQSVLDAPKANATTPSDASTDSPTAPASVFDRMGFIGASATAGYDIRVNALGADGETVAVHGADLGDVFRAAYLKPGTVSRYGTMFFFADPIRTGRSVVSRVLRFKPSCVIAVDFLFWYGYGAINAESASLTSEAQRLELLEVGLTQLDRIVQTGVPVVVGDFPDMSDAVGKMLSARQMPEKKTLEQLNARLAEWASTRANVRVLHLSTLAPALDRGDPIPIRGRTWSKKDDGALLQRDRLHPTFIGAMAMLAKACELVELTSQGDATAPSELAACDETFCFEPVRVTARFLAQARAGNRRDREPPQTSPEAPAAPAPQPVSPDAPVAPSSPAAPIAPSADQ